MLLPMQPDDSFRKRMSEGRRADDQVLIERDEHHKTRRGAGEADAPTDATG